MRDGLIRLRFLGFVIHLLILFIILIFEKEMLAKKDAPMFLEISNGELQAQHLLEDLDRRINSCVTGNEIDNGLYTPDISFPSQDDVISDANSSTPFTLPGSSMHCNDTIFNDELSSVSFLESADSYSLPDIIIEPENSMPLPDSSMNVNDTIFNDELSAVLFLESADNHSLPDLLIEPKNSVSPLPFPSGRIICDIEYVIIQARKLEEHNYKCNFNGKLIYNKTLTRGLVHTYTFVCDKTLCGHTETF